MPIGVAIIIGILVGLIVGMFNGLVISQTTIPPFIVTLATMNIAKGLAYVYTGGSPVRVVTKEWQFIGAGYIGPFPTPVVILVAVLIVTAIFMNKTKIGRHMYAVGGNQQAAEETGNGVILNYAQVHSPLIKMELVAPIMLDFAKKATVPVCVHLDHGSSIETCIKAIQLGFTSVMIDASGSDYEANVAETAEVVRLAHYG